MAYFKLLVYLECVLLRESFRVGKKVSIELLQISRNALKGKLLPLDNTYVTSPQINVSYLAKGMADSSTTPIEPGDVKLTAHVTIVYEIGSD